MHIDMTLHEHITTGEWIERMREKVEGSPPHQLRELRDDLKAFIGEINEELEKHQGESEETGLDQMDVP